MSPQSSTSSLQSLNESSSTKNGNINRNAGKISDERFNGISNYVYFISCMICNNSLCWQFFKTVI